ncbi:DEAD/DEAH box helicase family protein [Haloterrigena alkaliphila]|uniref:DEAD/DEAH box helicase family protein n=1 Tax=Haloterrigena alkaliphila TaxID=2816475 RepID=A0A8A2VKE1_9EURY|nr:DEAD/DEAH box helicase family protein [Haloterrigena alkaliphila]QSX01098.1 DEAD/DEAH box helicase family protein [Haloterrigena alkaliphila]
MSGPDTAADGEHGLRQLQLQEEYRLGDDPLNEFYIPALRQSTRYDRAAGFFDSKSLQYAAQGIAGLIANGGSMRLITSPNLKPADIEALQAADNREAEQSVLADRLEATLFEGDYLEFVNTDRFQCLAWMVEQDLLDIRIAYLPEGDEANPFRLYHEKLGVIRDDAGHRVAFSGSINETAAGWTDNYESFDVFRSWQPGEATRVDNKEQAFEQLWDNDDPMVTVRELPEAIEAGLEECSPGTVDGLPALEMFFSEEGANGSRTMKNEDEIELWDHQQEAIQWWRNHDYQGLFAMATGSGKTLTALRAARLQADVRLTVVVVPSKVLLQQWKEEIQSVFGSDIDIQECSGDTDWKANMTSLVDPFRVGSLDAVHDLPRSVVLTTLHTASSETFLNYLKHVPPERLQLIVDEVHRAGAPTFQSIFDIDAGRRIGLSATPDRQWDEEGTNAIYSYFGGHEPFRFTTQEAIENGYLTEYEYHPIICELTPQEFEDYAELSVQIERLSAQISSNDRVDESVINQRDHLLRERADIKKTAARKPDRFEAFLSTDHPRPALVFCEDTEQIEELEHQLEAHTDIDYGVYISNREEEQAEAFYRFEHDLLDYLLAIKCLDEGVDVPDCSTAVIIASSRNKREFIQRRGRVLRQTEAVDRAQIYDMLVLPGLGAPPDDERARSLVKQELERAKILMEAAENQDSVEQRLAEELDTYGRSFKHLAYI